MEAKILQGDSLEVLKSLEAGSAQTCVTSPPYFGLRNYGVDGQIGLEKTPDEYIRKLVEIFREVRRVLKDDGTLWLNLGDSYASAWGSGGRINKIDNPSRTGRSDTVTGTGYKEKDLMMIPARVAIALQADGWYLRSEIVWAKPNPMPESVRDRPTKSHEMIYLLSKQPKYYYDYKAILEPANYDGRKDTRMKGAKKYPNGFVPPNVEALSLHVKGHERWSNKITGRTEKKMAGTGYGGDGKGLHGHSGYFDADGNLRTHQFADGIPARNKRDVWFVSTKPYRQAHFATFPTALIEPCILAGCPEGGWVLDPFNGSGTSGYVALKNNRNYIGIELNPSYIELTHKRLSELQMKLLEAQ